MKRAFCLILALTALLSLAGCGGIRRELPEDFPASAGGMTARAEGEKDCYLEVTTPEGESLGVIAGKEILDALLDDDNTAEPEECLRDLTPEYICRLWQQKTLLAGQDPAAREYEVVMTITTFRGSDYIQVSILWELAGLWGFPGELAEELLNLTCRAPAEAAAALREAVSGL